MTRTLLASAATLDDLQDAIRDFYCGSAISLQQTSNTSWCVVRADGQTLDDVTVRKLKRRYRFEMAPPGIPCSNTREFDRL